VCVCVCVCVSLAGWDRTGNNVFGRVLTGIHHPNGDQKKISQTTLATTASKYEDNANWASINTHIKVTWAQGTTESGSSGSALFNPEGRIVGQLHGGAASCTFLTSPDWYVLAG
jgi:lysyl endopeptidase